MKKDGGAGQTRETIERYYSWMCQKEQELEDSDSGWPEEQPLTVSVVGDEGASDALSNRHYHAAALRRPHRCFFGIGGGIFCS